MEWLASASAVNLVIIGAFLIAALLIVVRNVKTLKVGKAELSAGERTKDDRKLFIEIMNFTWKLNDGIDEGERFYKKQARREVKERIHSYAVLMKAAYRKKLLEKNPDDYRLTYAAFTEAFDGQFYMKQMLVLMDCYEHNHISDLGDSELKDRARGLYVQISDLFKEMFMESWLEEMCPYEDLRDACFEIEESVNELLFKCLKDIQTTLRQLYRMRTALQNVKNAAYAWTIEKGPLPAKVASLADQFFEPVKGLNADRVNECLEAMRL